MKTRKLTLLLSILMMGAVLAVTGQPARGPNNNNRGNSANKKVAVKLNKNKAAKGNEHMATRVINRRPDAENRPVMQRNASYNTYYTAVQQKNYKPNKKFVKVKVPNHFAGYRDYRYYPEYGHTVKHFKSKPVVFKNKGKKYYYYDGHFYNYHNKIGYVWIESPYGMVFPTLPVGTVALHIQGRPYFQYRDVYFAHHPYGYEIVQLPVRYYKPRPVIQISASF